MFEKFFLVSWLIVLTAFTGVLSFGGLVLSWNVRGAQKNFFKKSIAKVLHRCKMRFEIETRSVRALARIRF